MLNAKILGQGPPLIILHGPFGTLDNWQTLGKRWAKDHTVFLVDQRNHGRSPHLDGHSYPLMAEDLADFMEGEWLHEAIILGHSMGGKTAMQLALHYPDLVKALIVVDILPKTYPGGHDQIFAALRSMNIDQIQSRSEAEDHLAQTISEAGVRQFLLKNLSRRKEGGFQWKMNLEVLYRDYQQILAKIEGPTYDGPTLFIRGDRSHYISDEDWPQALSLFPGATLETVANSGHWVHAEQADALDQLVTGFLAQNN
ncbi:MAG: alpha/beta fold hydrolase [Bacteroidota bacterium]